MYDIPALLAARLAVLLSCTCMPAFTHITYLTLAYRLPCTFIPAVSSFLLIIFTPLCTLAILSRSQSLWVVVAWVINGGRMVGTWSIPFLYFSRIPLRSSDGVVYALCHSHDYAVCQWWTPFINNAAHMSMNMNINITPCSASGETACALVWAGAGARRDLRRSLKHTPRH